MTWADENKGWREKSVQHWASKNTEPLRIRGWLKSTISWSGYNPITIEGPLQSAVILHETGRLPDDVYASCPLSLPYSQTEPCIPIVDRYDYGDIPLAHASWGVPFSRSVESVRWRRSRPRAELYAGSKITIGSGPVKATNLPSPVLSIPYLDFFVVGDRVKITTLLRECHHLGSHRSGGLGEVWGWEVEPHEDWSFFGPEKRLMRSVPALGEKPAYSDTREASLRAPYWHHKTRLPCFTPQL